MISAQSRLSVNTRKLINNLFNVIAEYDLVYTDHNFDILEECLRETKKKTYSAKDKYIIVHYDTDYYLPGSSYGLTIHNLIKTFDQLDIPLHTIIFVTNHKGIEREFNKLIPDKNKKHNFPIIIDNCMMCFKVSSEIAEVATNTPINVDKITKHAMCLMGCKRIHRNVLFNFIKKNNLLNKIITAYSNI
jgi:hypothetical protein